MCHCARICHRIIFIYCNLQFNSKIEKAIRIKENKIKIEVQHESIMHESVTMVANLKITEAFQII